MGKLKKKKGAMDSCKFIFMVRPPWFLEVVPANKQFPRQKKEKIKLVI